VALPRAAGQARVILVCAATATETAACRAGIADAGAPGIEVLTTGVGPERAAAALRAWLRSVRPSTPASRSEAYAQGEREGRAAAAPATPTSVRPERSAAGAESKGPGPMLIVSSGFCGALTDAIPPLSWITASSLHRLDDGRALPVALPPGLLRVAEGALVCDVISAAHVVTPPVAGLAGPAAADMESAALGEVAGAAGIPFLVLRLVTDTPARPLPRAVHGLSAALAAHGVTARFAQGARAALLAARAPARTAAFLRDALAWRERLRARWCEEARRGVPSAPRAPISPRA
jgi:hypothetical protein